MSSHNPLEMIASPGSVEFSSVPPTETVPGATETAATADTAEGFRVPVGEQESGAPAEQPAEQSGEPGSLLKELEARQDEVLESLAELDQQICDVLRDCGVTIDGEEEYSRPNDHSGVPPTRRAA